MIYGGLPLSHLAGLALLAALFPLALATDRLMAGGLTTLVLIVVAVWQSRHPRRLPLAPRGLSRSEH